jgi:SAM-dependent methyltransferase
MTHNKSVDDKVQSADWIRYNNELNPRDRRMSEAWVRKLAQWLAATGIAGRGKAVLDFGCGYFDLGVELVGKAQRVDGFDINPDVVALARGRTQGLPGISLFTTREAVPPLTYDVMVVNSVLQYFASFDDVETFLAFAHSRLKRGPSLLVLADLLPPRYASALDAMDSLIFAARNGLVRPMLRHLFNAACMPRGMALLRISPAAISQASARHGFSVEFLPENLTPSKRRYTCILRLREFKPEDPSDA